MSDLEKVMNVPIGILAQHMMPTEIRDLTREAIEKGIIKGRQKGTEAFNKMPYSKLSIEHMGIN